MNENVTFLKEVKPHEHCFCRRGLTEYSCCGIGCYAKACEADKHCFCAAAEGLCCRCRLTPKQIEDVYAEITKRPQP